MIKEDFFKPKEGHLCSGRDNDNENFQESIYQVKFISGVLMSELKRSIRRIFFY